MTTHSGVMSIAAIQLRQTPLASSSFAIAAALLGPCTQICSACTSGTILATHGLNSNVSTADRATQASLIQPTGRQHPIVGLGVEVNLDHLTPAPWSKHTKDIIHITRPPIRMDATSHHPTVDEVKMVGRECRRTVEIIDLKLEVPGHVFWYRIWVHVDSDDLGNSLVS